MEKLTAKQSNFIIILTSAPSVNAAIRESGVSSRTAWRWLKDPYFNEQLRKARREVLFHASGKLTAATERAVETLTNIMEDDSQPAASRVQAARIIIDTAYNSIQADDIQERIEQLERDKGVTQ